jgi:DNA-binding LacI/PurR family transcriptional regulator
MADAVDHRQATLQDVAAATGVHVSTVSRVLNGSPALKVRPETRRRIHEAAESLNYRPNAIARSLRLAATGTLGLLVPSLRNPVYSAIIRGAFDRARGNGFVVVLAEDTDDEAAPEAYDRLVRQGRIDGLLIASIHPDSPLQALALTQEVPFVFVNRRCLLDGQSNVSMREEDAGRLAARHLIGLGHRRLAHLAGPADLDTSARREVGFREVVEAAGIQPIVHDAPFEEHGGHRAMQHMLMLDPPPTGVFVSNLNQSIGALAAARRMGLQVPADVSIIGYDDDPVGEYLEPPLTALRMPMHQLGAVGVDEMLSRIAGGAPRDIVLEEAPELVVRASTGRPPAG